MEPHRHAEQSGIKREHMSKTLVLQWASRVKFSPSQLTSDLALAGDRLIPTAWFVCTFCLASC